MDRVCAGPGNPGKYLKVKGGPGKSWKSVNSSYKVFLKDIEEKPDGKMQQLKNNLCVFWVLEKTF